MGRTELPWLFAGRLVRPYALAVSLASGFQGMLIVTGQTTYGAGTWADVIATAAFAGTLLLWVGWWTSSTNLMQHGLLLTAGVFAARAAYVALGGAPLAAGFLACWSVASGGAWLLEQTTGHQRHRPWRPDTHVRRRGGV